MPVEWHSPTSINQLPPKVEDWLLHTGSLTERLQAHTPTFEVELLGQAIQTMDSSELKVLDQRAQQLWQVREVLLKGSQQISSNSQQVDSATPQQNWVFARSVLPNELCESAWANLGNQPLGQRIFNDPSFVRSEFEIGRLLFNPVTGEDYSRQNFWARRSKFKIDKFELLVAEAFLPQCPCYW